MNVVFYNNKSDNNEVSKELTNVGSFDCELHRECSVQTPTMIVPMSDALLSANYCYIPKFGRYYYIAEMNIFSGDLVAISLKVDVLKSFWNDFKGSRCQAKRSSSKPNYNLPDETKTYKPQPKYYARKLSSMEFTPNNTTGYYVLTVGGR